MTEAGGGGRAIQQQLRQQVGRYPGRVLARVLDGLGGLDPGRLARLRLIGQLEAAGARWSRAGCRTRRRTLRRLTASSGLVGFGAGRPPGPGDTGLRAVRLGVERDAHVGHQRLGWASGGRRDGQLRAIAGGERVTYQGA